MSSSVDRRHDSPLVKTLSQLVGGIVLLSLSVYGWVPMSPPSSSVWPLAIVPIICCQRCVELLHLTFGGVSPVAPEHISTRLTIKGQLKTAPKFYSAKIRIRSGPHWSQCYPLRSSERGVPL